MTTFKDRVPYSAIFDRPPLKLPGGARMVVWTIVNVEYWDSAGAMPRAVLPPPMGQPRDGAGPQLPVGGPTSFGISPSRAPRNAMMSRISCGVRPRAVILASSQGFGSPPRL